ncbi:nucleotide exchange factor GrpE [Salinispira pacifica]|uniref:Protein GrpE n=1 Tax=Salinispira pacifica TaxID=1307761 RepID=V5WGR7_9SPIO|nr:nucleotide exchange factor GrpE [Salinispira pacifica]AHC14754.1 Heat shock protein GrpE [Salinispira pacifica]
MAVEDKEQQVDEASPESGSEDDAQAEAGEGSELSTDDDLSVKDKEIERLQQENSDLKDQFLRKQADMDNFRKRLLKEKEDAITFANKQLLLDLITIIDNFERAIKSSEGARDFDSFHDGIVMIEKEFVGMLERKWHLTRFESEGEEFDPMKHEAMMVEESSDHDHQVVLQDFQKGYMLKDQVLRAAKVKVSQPVSEARQEAGDQAKAADETHDDGGE